MPNKPPMKTAAAIKAENDQAKANRAERQKTQKPMEHPATTRARDERARARRDERKGQ